jgi:hypothetical protein
MRSALSALGRWSAIGGLWLVLGLAILVSMLGGAIESVALGIADWAAEQRAKIKGEDR